MRISDWSSDVCSSDLAMKHGSKDETALIRDAIMHGRVEQLEAVLKAVESTGAIPYTRALAERHSLKAVESLGDLPDSPHKKAKIGRASCRERVCQYV